MYNKFKVGDKVILSDRALYLVGSDYNITYTISSIYHDDYDDIFEPSYILSPSIPNYKYLDESLLIKKLP